MKRLFYWAILFISSTAMADDAYVPVDLSTRDSVSGESLLAGAYISMFILGIGYAIWLAVRHYKTR